MPVTIFNSQDTFYKTPFGAVRAGETVAFTLTVPVEFGCTTPYLLFNRDGEQPSLFPLQKQYFRNGMDVFSTTIQPQEPGLYFYYFDLYTGYRKLYAGQLGEAYVTTGDGEAWQLTVYEKDFQTPSHLRGGVIYQIFPDRFFESSPHATMPYADRIYRPDKRSEPYFWPNEQHEGYLNMDYYGGDLPGIRKKLTYLASLGVTCIYLNPIFEAHANHRYNTADYRKVDPVLGTNEDFAELCRAAKARGIDVVLDGVFSHTGSDSVYFNREGRYASFGAWQGPDSPYRRWYDFSPNYPHGYRCWWGFETLPEVNEEDRSYREFICGEGGVIDYWLGLGASGFRLDVADELPDEFIEKVRTAVKRVSPDKFLLGEVWEDATTKFGFDKRRTYLLGKGLDSVMNYPFKNAVLGFVCGRDAGQTMTDILSICEHYPAPALDTALNFLSTHDTERALTVIADEPANGRGREWQSGRCVTGDAYEEGMLKLRMAYAIIYTLPGVPCLYYGDEIGMQGYRDPFNRGFYCWNSHEERLKPVLAQLAQLRHTCEAFRTGELRVLRAEGGVLHYQRIGEFEAAEIIVNRTEHIIVEPLASGKHTEVNPMGFTIVVEEVGHNPNHSYYDYK